MNASHEDTAVDSAALDAAFQALRNYDRGSSRAALVPIDQAVAVASGNPAVRKELEGALLAALKAAGSDVAREYICAKLTLIGTEACVPAMMSLARFSRLTAPACNVLQSVPGTASIKALRKLLASTAGPEQAAVICSLGFRGDEGSVADLLRLVRSADRAVAAAAVHALGEIGSAKAARALRAVLEMGPAAGNAGDASLVCAGKLKAKGHAEEARKLWRLLKDSAQPAHVRAAAGRALQ